MLREIIHNFDPFRITRSFCQRFILRDKFSHLSSTAFPYVVDFCFCISLRYSARFNLSRYSLFCILQSAKLCLQFSVSNANVNTCYAALPCILDFLSAGDIAIDNEQLFLLIHFLVKTHDLCFMPRTGNSICHAVNLDTFIFEVIQSLLMLFVKHR
ncbi:MAG: hypothetical protein B7X11_02845 [Acidobacteria bacterium 37-65-4]|nr:MAG: hypothetical protein B7X11_02845 [Acidobacteria bacterium 37-65-4]